MFSLGVAPEKEYHGLFAKRGGLLVRHAVTDPEMAAIKFLKSTQAALPHSCFLDLADAFAELRRLFPALSHGRDLHEGGLVLIGLLNHTYNFLLGGLEQISAGNPHQFSASAKGIIEAFGAVVYIEESVGRITTFVSGDIKAGVLYNAANRGEPGILNDLKKLNRIVHPAQGSINSGFRVEPSGESTVYRMGPQPLHASEALSAARFITKISRLVAARIQKVADEHPDILKSGKKLLSMSGDP